MRPARRPIRRAVVRRNITRGPVARWAFRRTRRRIWRRTRRLIVGTSVLLLIGGSERVVKIKSSDIEKIEAETGKSVDDLTEEELASVMRKRGIQSIQLSPQDEVEISQVENNGFEDDNSARFCPYCGKSISLGSKFCPGCGAKL